MIPQVPQVSIGKVAFGGGKPLAIIAGPCVIESEEHSLKTADFLAKLADKLKVGLVYKSSFDKANRSSASAFRGFGIEEGLRILEKVRQTTGLPIITDVHNSEQVQKAGQVVDCLQIPAFLSRQTDLLQAAGRTGKPVAVKKGQFLAPWDMGNVKGKIEAVGNNQVLLMERGASFGYNNLVSDMRSLPIMRNLGAPVIFDATHSAQLPGGQGTSSGGDREMAKVLARSAVAAGCDGLFLEVHENPAAAPCDGPNMIPLAELEILLKAVIGIDQIVRN